MAYPRSGWDIYLPEWANLTSPLIVTAMFEIKDFENMIKLIWSVKEYGGDSHLAIFDMTEVKNEHKAKNQQDDFRNMYSVSGYLTSRVEPSVLSNSVQLLLGQLLCGSIHLNIVG